MSELREISSAENIDFSKIVGAKLITGELVVATKTKGGLEKPMLIRIAPTKDNKLAIRLFPFVLPVLTRPKSSPEIASKFILGYYEITEELEKAYISSITGIEMPSIDS